MTVRFMDRINFIKDRQRTRERIFVLNLNDLFYQSVNNGICQEAFHAHFFVHEMPLDF